MSKWLQRHLTTSNKDKICGAGWERFVVCGGSCISCYCNHNVVHLSYMLILLNLQLHTHSLVGYMKMHFSCTVFNPWLILTSLWSFSVDFLIRQIRLYSTDTCCSLVSLELFLISYCILITAWQIADSDVYANASPSVCLSPFCTLSKRLKILSVSFSLGALTFFKSHSVIIVLNYLNFTVGFYEINKWRVYYRSLG